MFSLAAYTTPDLVTFTEEILNRKLPFLCSATGRTENLAGFFLNDSAYAGVLQNVKCNSFMTEASNI